MANLYEISERYKNIQDLIGNEEITEEFLEKAAEDVEDELQEKLLNIAKLCKNIKGNKAMIKEERDRLKNKETILDNQLKSLENYTKLCLNNAGLKKMDLGVFKISLRKSESTEITDLSLIPKEFLKFKDPEPNKTEIKKAIKEGREIQGAVIIENESLVIK